jgi:hypothetical protein
VVALVAYELLMVIIRGAQVPVGEDIDRGTVKEDPINEQGARLFAGERADGRTRSLAPRDPRPAQCRATEATAGAADTYASRWPH